MQNPQSSSILSTQLQQDRMHLTIVHIFPSFYPLPDPKVLHDTNFIEFSKNTMSLNI